MKKSKLLAFFLFFLIIPAVVQALTLADALDLAAEYFVKKAVKIQSGQEIHVLDIVNVNTLQSDAVGEKVKTELVPALEKHSPDFIITSGKSHDFDKDNRLSGIYEQKGETINLKLRISKGQEILAQYEVEYEVEIPLKRILVAVLDIESKTMDKTQSRAFSDVFRSILNDTNTFDLVGNANIDKMNPDTIQKATGCTRDSCATIIGEQLGVERVVSTSLYKVDKNMYILSSKILDVREGAALVSRTVEHIGDIKNLKSSLEEMAIRLTGKPDELKINEDRRVSDSNSPTLKHAMERAAVHFTRTAIKIEPGQKLHILEIVNDNSRKQDALAKQIETELYFALERQYPDFKLFLGKGENTENEIFLSGNYEPKGEKTTVRLKVVEGDKILARFETDFHTKAHQRSLVAVLDLETDELTIEQRRAYSDIFRARLNEIDVFDIASSADVDKLDPDAVQQKTDCTRDSCAIIIGRQLGVDRVVSSSLFEVDEGSYIISSKVMDVYDASVLVAKTVEHTGDLKNLQNSLNKLANNLTGHSERAPVHEETGDLLLIHEESSRVPWHVAAVTMALASIWKVVDDSKSRDDLKARNEELANNYGNTIDDEERANYYAEYNENEDKIEQYESNIANYKKVAILALVWEICLVYYDMYPNEMTHKDSAESPWTPLVRLESKHNGFSLSQKLTLSWKW
ncbi:MAG: hypothetical protein GY866_13915 [Proteobacteria bacterium]|nr:hypothetical protein [Pseudomonadota bacterium]